MAKPAITPIDSAVEAWDQAINDALDVLSDGPIPIKEYADAASLPTASSYDECLAFTSDTKTLWKSNGTVWIPLGGPVIASSEAPVGYDSIHSKVIYSKSFSFALANAGAQTQAHGITGLDVATGDFMQIEAVASDGTDVRALPWYDGTDRLEVKVDATNITITSTKDETSTTAFVTLYYTK